MSEHAPTQSSSDRHLDVAVVTPEGAAYEGRAASVTIPAHDGEVSFFPLHAAFVGAIGVGELRVATLQGAVLRYYLEGGVAQVRNDVVTILAEQVADAAMVDAASARQDLAEALAEVPTTDTAFEERDRKEASARVRARIAERPAHEA